MPRRTDDPAVQRLLTRRERLARAAAAALAHGHEDGPALEQSQYDLEETLEGRLPVTTWRRLWPTWRELDLLLAHEPTAGKRSDDCVLCAKDDAVRRRNASTAAAGYPESVVDLRLPA